jgi:hypothetical protein
MRRVQVFDVNETLHQPRAVDGEQPVGGQHDAAQRLVQGAGRVAQVVELPQRLADLLRGHRPQTTTRLRHRHRHRHRQPPVSPIAADHDHR